VAFSFASNRKTAEEEGLIGGGDYFKVKNGDNRIRLMSECLPHADTFKGERNFKWLCYVIDRKDGKVKPYFMPHTIYKQIEALQTNDDYAFSDVPMPYDLTVNVMNAGTKEAKYAVIPARKESPVTALEYQALADAKPLKDLQKALKDKKGASEPPPQDDHSQDFDDDDIPPFMRG
jgi:hypothetical protein